MAALRLLNRARVPTQADLSVPNRQPRGAVQIADGITAHFVYLMGAHKRLRDLSGDGAILTNYGGSIEGAESSYITQDSGVQGFYTGNIESLAGKPVTIVFFGEKGRLSATTNPYRVLFGVSDSNLVDGSSTWRLTLGNDFGGAGTKESVRYEGPDSTGLYINGHKQADATISDGEYAVGARLNVVTTVSALPAGGSANIWVGSNGAAPANKRGMKGHVELVAVIEGELSESKCLALSAGDYSVLFKAANDSPFLAPVAADVSVLAAGPDEATPEAVSAAITQRQVLAAGTDTLTPEALAGAIAQHQVLAAGADTLTPEALAGAIAQRQVLAAGADTLTPEALAGALGGRVVLAAGVDGLTPEALAGAIAQRHVVVLGPDEITPEAISAAIAQRQVLAAGVDGLTPEAVSAAIATAGAPALGASVYLIAVDGGTPKLVAVDTGVYLAPLH